MLGNNLTAEATMKRTFGARAEMAHTRQGGMEVATPRQARIADQAGARAVTTLDHLPVDISSPGGMRYLELIKQIEQVVSIPVMAKAGATHFNMRETQSPADNNNHINKNKVGIPFVRNCHNLREALQGILHGATMICTKDTGDVSETVHQVHSIMSEINQLCNMNEDKLIAYAKSIGTPFELVMKIKQSGRMSVPFFAFGGVATPADAALMMDLGCDGIFVGSHIFMSHDPAKQVHAFAQAITHYNDPKILAAITIELDDTMISSGDSNAKL